MDNLNFLLHTTNCNYCKFFTDKCTHKDAEKNEELFHEIHELFEEDPSSFGPEFKEKERQYYVCDNYEFDEAKFIALHTRD